MLLGGWWFTVVVLPLFHGIPKALYWSFKGTLRFRSCFIYLGAFLLWNVLFTVAMYVLLTIAPEMTYRTLTDPMFYYGNLFGAGLALIRSLSKSGRKNLSEEFEGAVSRYRIEK